MTHDLAIALDTLLRGLAMGAFAVTLLVLLTGQLSAPMRALAAATFIAIIAHVADGLLVLQELPSFIRRPVWFASNIVPGFLWAFLLGVFDDRQEQFWPRLLPVALLALTLAGALAIMTSLQAYWYAYYAATNAMMVHILWVLWRGWQGDLIEARRRLRTPVIILTALYIALNALANLVSGPLASTTTLFHLVQASGLVVLAAGSALGFLQAGPSVWRAPEARFAERGETDGSETASDATSHRRAGDGMERVLLERLRRALEVDQVWQREGLSIAVLARELGAPEYRLRRLINERLGYRNFADFVNSHRIAAARARLADPAQASLPVSQLAFDLGFGSLGPFNRAFRQATGQTPSQWRDRALANL